MHHNFFLSSFLSSTDLINTAWKYTSEAMSDSSIAAAAAAAVKIKMPPKEQ